MFFGAMAIILGVNAFGKDTKIIKEGLKMKIAVLAASGKVGRFITQEALKKGYKVSAFVRNNTKVKDLESSCARIIQKDIFELDSKDLLDFDVVIDAFGVVEKTELYDKHIKHLSKILQGSDAKLLVVGGAGSLYMDKAHKNMLMDTEGFPKEYLPVAKAHGEVLRFLREQKGLNWVYVSPPAEFIFDAPKSGKYKIIGEEFETNSKGESKGSYADYASAIIDIVSDSTINKVRVGVIGL